jgi:hypothetical protein
MEYILSFYIVHIIILYSKCYYLIHYILSLYIVHIVTLYSTYYHFNAPEGLLFCYGSNIITCFAERALFSSLCTKMSSTKQNPLVQIKNQCVE